MEVKCFPKTTLMRQTMEAHVIEMNMGKSKVVNRRGKWGQNLPPKLVVEGQEGSQDGKGKRSRGGWVPSQVSNKRMRVTEPDETLAQSQPQKLHIFMILGKLRPGQNRLRYRKTLLRQLQTILKPQEKFRCPQKVKKVIQTILKIQE